MTHPFNEIKEQFSDGMRLTGHDILNTVSGGNMPTLRKAIDRNCGIQAKATQAGIIKSNLIDIFKEVPESDMNADFFRGYSVAEIVLNSALHNFFMEQYDVGIEDIDIVFSVKNHKPTLEIEIDGGDDFGGDNGDDLDDLPLEPKPNLRPEVKKLKEDLDL
jgi:hypothetical protein|tara:strand:+ start:41 stop:523 length:483 start_codon:yes stop_codon:yes gene_type:complete